MLSGKKADPSQPVVQGRTDEELAKTAGVSPKTIQYAIDSSVDGKLL
jgi:hypothetical protein